MLAWLVLNFVMLAFLGCLFVIWIFFGSNTHLFPGYLFSPNIENEFRTLSIRLEYRPAGEWKNVLEAYNAHCKVRFHLLSIDNLVPELKNDLPAKVRDASRALPRTPFSYCNDFDYLNVFDFSSPFKNADEARQASSATPSPPLLFLRADGRYWCGKAVLILDNAGSSFYMLLAAESTNFFGSGLFFDLKPILLLSLFVLLLSCLWWLPFVHRLSSPLIRMIRFAEHMAENEFRPSGHLAYEEPASIARSRSDEIGRLAQALLTMGKRGESLVTGQMQYIRHVAHEINTPISEIQMGLAVMESRLDGENRQRIRGIMDKVEKVSDLTNDVLDLLRAKASPDRPVPEPVELNAFLQSCISRENMEDRTVLLCRPGITAIADKKSLNRAISNILRNAMRYAGEQAEILIEVSQQEKNTEIRISDNGPGIPEEEIHQIFEPFFRGKDAALSHPGGTGLGLSLVKYSIEICGGSVQYEKVEPHGFAVILSLPAEKTLRTA